MKSLRIKNVTCKPGSRCAHWNYDFNTKPTEGFLFLISCQLFCVSVLSPNNCMRSKCALFALYEACSMNSVHGRAMSRKQRTSTYFIKSVAL